MIWLGEITLTNIDFFGGVDEIGGNKIRVRGKEESFFFDFGMAFSKANEYLSEFLQPRKANGILDFVQLGLLPCIKGIYREDYLRHVGLSHPEKPSIDGVLISHSHVDHVAYVHHLREDIPIYLSNESYLILKALEDTGTSSFSEYLHLKKTFHKDDVENFLKSKLSSIENEFGKLGYIYLDPNLSENCHELKDIVGHKISNIALKNIKLASKCKDCHYNEDDIQG